jgi:hypothetical protein
MAATATSVQWVKATTGSSMPNISQSFVRSGSLAMKSPSRAITRAAEPLYDAGRTRSPHPGGTAVPFSPKVEEALV